MTKTGPVEVLHRKPRIIGWDRRSRPIWSIAGGSGGNAPESTGGAGDGGNPPAGGGEEGGGESEEESEEESESEEQEGGAAQSAAKRKADREFKERTKRRQAEQENERLRARLEEIEERDKTDLDKATSKATKAEQRIATMEPALRRRAIEVAFLKASLGDGAKRKPIYWVDGDDVLTIAQKELEGVEVSDDGEIDMDEVRAVVDDIAKRKSHLVRRQQQQQPPSGGNVGAGQQPPGEPSPEQDAKKYPALRTRI